MFLQGLPPHAWPPLLTGALICSGQQQGAGPPGAALAPNEPFGTVSVCPGQLCVCRCLIMNFHKWFLHCGVKSCLSDAQLTCDSVWCELLASAAPASVYCLIWWCLPVSRGFALVKSAVLTAQSQNNSVYLQNRYHITTAGQAIFFLTSVINLMKRDQLHELYIPCALSCASLKAADNQTTVNFDVALIRCRAVWEEAKASNYYFNCSWTVLQLSNYSLKKILLLLMLINGPLGGRPWWGHHLFLLVTCGRIVIRSCSV